MYNYNPHCYGVLSEREYRKNKNNLKPLLARWFQQNYTEIQYGQFTKQGGHWGVEDSPNETHIVYFYAPTDNADAFDKSYIAIHKQTGEIAAVNIRVSIPYPDNVPAEVLNQRRLQATQRIEAEKQQSLQAQQQMNDPMFLLGMMLQGVNEMPAQLLTQTLYEEGLPMMAETYNNTPNALKPVARAKIIEILTKTQNKTGQPITLPPSFPADIRADWNAMQQGSGSSTDPRGIMPREGGEATSMPTPALSVTDPQVAVVQAVREALLAQSTNVTRQGMSISCGAPTALQKKTRQLAIHNMLTQLKVVINNGGTEVPLALYQTCVANPRLDFSTNAAFLRSLDAEIARTAVAPEIATQTTTVASIKGKQGMDALIDELPLLAAHGAAGALFGKAFFDKPVAGAIAAPVIMHFLSPLMKKM
jgi:hypothetical protein